MTNATSRKLIRTALLALTLSALPATAGPDIYGLGDGSDGPLGVGSLNVMINQYAAVTGPLAPGDTFIPVSTTTGFGGNDLVLIIQMTGIVPEPPVGTPGPTDISNDPVGRWELARLASAGGTSMTLTAPLLYSYAAGVTQVVRVPEYTTVNISGSGSLIARSWNGSIGGILAFVAQGTVTNSGSISGTNRGFRSVQSLADVTGQTGCSGLDELLGLGGRKGEGLVATAFGTTGRGRVTNGAGGGVCLKSGGGGGGNGGAGGQGGNSDLATDGNRPVGGQGGTALIYSSIDHLTMGGSGGAGHAANSLGQPGGAGGGIIFIRAGGLAGLGNIVTNGINAAFGSAQGGSGGGAGGTIYVRLAGPATCNLLSATGGRGANTNGSSQGTITGPGGGGGGGRILFQTCEDFCTQTATVSGGQSGVDQPTFDPYGAEAGGDGEFIVIPGCYTVLAIPVIVTPAHNSTTNDSTPDYTGTLDTGAPPGTEVVLYVDGIEVGRVTPDDSGNWTFTQPTALSEGSHTVYAVAVNTGLSLQSPPSPTHTFTIDLTPPAPPVVLLPADGAVTSDNTPTYSGTAEPGSLVTVMVDGTPVGTIAADGAGNWTFTPASPVEDGAHTVRVTATDAVGNTSPTSSPNTFTVDTLPPAAPVVIAPANGSVTSDNTPTYSGIAEPGSVVTIVVEGTPVGTTMADGAGNWSLTPVAPLADGPHSVSATATDAVGNISPTSNTNAFTVDTMPPAAPVVLIPANGSVTGNNTPTFSGTAEPGSTVTVSMDGSSVGTTIADGAGHWSFTLASPVADGTHTVHVTATDAVGNTSPDSSPNTFTVDTTAPAAPVVETPADGSLIGDNTPTYSGTAEPGSTVTVIVDGASVGSTTADGAGNWSLTPASALADGAHTVSATATDGVGNTSPNSPTNAFAVDTAMPPAPVVLMPVDGSVTNDNTPTYSGTAEPGSTVSVVVDGTPVGTTPADGSGNWSLTPVVPLADGPHSVSGMATDAVGNTSPDSSPNAFTVDTSAPAAPAVETPTDGSAISSPQPLFSGTAEPNISVSLFLDGAPLASLVADATGHWTFSPGSPLADGFYTATATATDAAGNTSEPSRAVRFLVDSTPPETNIVSGPSGDTPTPEATFDFDSNETDVAYECSLDGAPFTTCSNPTILLALSEGEHTLLVRARDSSGNVDPTPASSLWRVLSPSSPRRDRALLGAGLSCSAGEGDPAVFALMGLMVLFSSWRRGGYRPPHPGGSLRADACSGLRHASAAEHPHRPLAPARVRRRR